MVVVLQWKRGHEDRLRAGYRLLDGAPDQLVVRAAGVLMIREGKPDRPRTNVRARKLILRPAPASCLTGRSKAGAGVPDTGGLVGLGIAREHGDDRDCRPLPGRRDCRAQGEDRVVEVRREHDDARPELLDAVETEPAGRSDCPAERRTKQGVRRGGHWTIGHAWAVIFAAGPVGGDVLQIEPLGGLEEVRAEWGELAAAAENPFATPEWCQAWLDEVPLDCRLRLFAAQRRDGSIAAILPLVLTSGRYLRKLRFLGFGVSNELGPVAAPDDRPAATEALRGALAATRHEWDVFLGERLPGTGWAPALRGSLVRHVGSPIVRAEGGGWDEYLASRSSNLRQELRRKERRLSERGFRYRNVTSTRDLEAGLDALFALHRARWREEASRWFAGQEAFQRSFADTALERGWLRLRLLESSGTAVAGYLGFRFGPTEWFYQAGRDPSAESSVGLLLVAHALREAFSEGATEFRLGPGAQAYKLRFATGDPGLETVAVARGLRGRAALLAERRRGAW